MPSREGAGTTAGFVNRVANDPTAQSRGATDICKIVKPYCHENLVFQSVERRTPMRDNKHSVAAHQAGRARLGTAHRSLSPFAILAGNRGCRPNHAVSPSADVAVSFPDTSPPLALRI